MDSDHYLGWLALALTPGLGARMAGKLLREMGSLLTWDEPEYPARLREIHDPPPLLYVLGNIELLNRHLISIVGSRRPTPTGIKWPNA
jgi:predicted Rossmann fold nucleotide-binding protein DprA/Smf involved in DNA uptake